MFRRRAFQLSKEDGQETDDAIASCRSRGEYVLSDGASACYAGRAWARTLCRRFIRNGSVGPEWLAEARKEFRAGAMPSKEDWLGRIAFDRGSFATLLGFTINPREVQGIAIGDTVLFLKTADDVDMYPRLFAEDFERDPLLLSSHVEYDLFERQALSFEAHRFVICAPPDGWVNCQLLAMTDGLAAWVARSNDVAQISERLHGLLDLTDLQSLKELVDAEVAARRMRRDDVTLLVIEP
jgi:hypothetical protein